MCPRAKKNIVENPKPAASGEKKYVETPLMKQYYEIKAVHPDAILLFRVGDFYETFGEDAIKEIRITGGGASSPLWATIKSDVTGKVLKTLTESETACLGSALAAAVGIGEFASPKEAVDSVVKTKKVYEPTGIDYTEAYENYCKLDKLLN